jgi:hypothetical protein
MTAFDTAVRQAGCMLGPAAARGLAWETAPAGTGLPRLRYEFAGVAVDWLGGEESVIALGHVPPARFRVAANSLFLLHRGHPAPGTIRQFTCDVQHLWAVHAPGSTPSRWRLYRDADQSTPGAFPVTTYGPGW